MIQIDDNLILDEAMSGEKLQRLETITHQVLEFLSIESDLSIYIASNTYVQTLNAHHRGVDAPTDVLSFRAEPLPAEIAESEAPYLGDVILAYEYILDHALQASHLPEDEFGLLVVHGILHLIGYDHNTTESQQVMWAKQAELLEMLGINLIVPDFIHDE